MHIVRMRYSPEFKIATIQEYFCRKTNVEEFCKSRNVPTQTFYRWLQIYKRNEDDKNIELRNQTRLIDIAKPIKEIATKNENTELFTMKFRGIEFVFHINQLPEVMEELKK